MSSHSDESDVTAKNEDITQELEEEQEEDIPGSNGSIAESFSRTRPPEGSESGTDSPLPELNGTNFQGYSTVTTSGEEGGLDIPSSPTLSPPTRRDVESPGDSASIPDDTLSQRGSLMSSPPNSLPGSQISVSRTRRPGALHPFDRRFSARLSPSALASTRTISPASLPSHSRQASIASQVSLASATLVPSEDGSETPQPPWEVVRWTKLRKITGQVFSEMGKRNYGRPTVLAVSASIAIGTSKGLTVIFDYHQNLTATIGLGTKAVECGSVTSLAVSADHSTIACGHANGHIFTWEIARPAKPFLHILPIDREHLGQRKSDGHVSDTAIVHVGFLGTRHTALVSADQGGMAFSHLATRGMGAIGRVVRTTRILGRYPSVPGPNERPRKASSVLAFSSLPLGNVEQPTDILGLTALLTPYLLVIVSTTPIAETQFKTARPKEVAPHSTLSGCLAWFPAVKLKKPLPGSEQFVSNTKLVYCWSNVLTILDVNVEAQEEKDKPPILVFKPRSRWKSEEAIVGVQWLHRSVLGILTISQRLIILEDPSLHVTDSFDLIHKHIFHQDLFSKQLRAAVEQLDEDNQSMHGVVADAFHMSYKAYKGRLFLLGFNDLSLGTLSNWADRLLALMGEGDVIAAIQLATSYYSGEADKISVGLPEDDEARHAMVQEKLLDMISASLKYMFGRNLTNQDEEERQTQLKELAGASFIACMKSREINFIFEEVYRAYSEASKENIFFEVLEQYILDEEITAIPPDVLKDLITHYASQDRVTRLEEMICRLDTRTMDIHQIATLCKQYRLYDALIYVWNQAIGDYITPLIELMFLMKMIEYEKFQEVEEHSRHLASAMKVFPYLAYIFTGRIYPSGVEIDENGAQHAKTEAYGFLFSGRILDWPPGSGQVFHTKMDEDEEPPYPYLSLILRFDTPSFMSMLNEAFEDHFLNGPAEESANGFFEESSTAGKGKLLVPTRQTIISILLDVLGSDNFNTEDSIYLDIFIARNLPKFPQFIVLPGLALHKVLERLCNPPSEEVAEDCQLSVEYLLSFYHPPDLTLLIPLFRQAGFFRVLKSVYRGTKQYPELLETYFEDPNDRLAVFDCIGDCMRSGAGLTAKQKKEVESVIIRNGQALADIDTVRTARTLHAYTPQLIEPLLDVLEDGSHVQFVLLRTLMEPSVQDMHIERTPPVQAFAKFEERYVRLMCKYDPTHVADYIGLLKSGDLRLQEVLPAMEASGVIDAAVVLMARDGLVGEAMVRLVKHMQTLETALIGLIAAAAESPDESNTAEAVDDLLEAIQKYAKVGVWLCQGQTHSRASEHIHQSHKASKRKSILHSENPEADLALDERVWLDLLDIIVTITRDVSAILSDLDFTSQKPPSSLLDASKITSTLRTTVQTSFTTLLTSTARPPQPPVPTTTNELTPTAKAPSTQPHPSFLLILSAFLSRAARSSPTLADLRSVLQEIFAAYTFEENVLSLSNAFLEKDLFRQVEEEWRERQRGWRPIGYACHGCRKRVWGPGVGGDVLVAWEKRRKDEERVRKRRMEEGRGGGEVSESRGKGRAKGRVEGEGEVEEDEESGDGGVEHSKNALVVFACRHVWHRECLERVLAMNPEWSGELRCPAVHGT